MFDLQPVLGLMHDGNIPEENGADIIDPYMGLSHSLLLLINQISQIAWGDNIDNGSVDDNINVLHLKGRLENLQQIPPPLGDDAEAETECVAIAEANRLGALLLLYEVCSPAMQYTASEDMEKKKGWASRSLPILDLSGKDHCVRRILHLILERKTSMMRTAVLPLWPLFLAGCCAPTDAERVTVMQLFEELEGIRRFGVSYEYFLTATYQADSLEYCTGNGGRADGLATARFGCPGREKTRKWWRQRPGTV